MHGEKTYSWSYVKYQIGMFLCFSLSRSFLRTFNVDSASIIFVRSANYASVSLNGLVYTPSIVTLLCLITCPITVIDCQKTAKTRSSLHSDSRTVVSPSDVYSKIVTNLEHMLLNKWCIFSIFTLEIWTLRSKNEYSLLNRVWQIRIGSKPSSNS